MSRLTTRIPLPLGYTARYASTTSSKAWLARQAKDPYVKDAAASNYRARSAFKLLQIQDKYHIIRPGHRVLDCGAAPGGWSQVAAPLVAPTGHVYAVDLLHMDPLPHTTFLHGDLASPEILSRLETLWEGRGLDIVLSDMAPSLSGIKRVDHTRSINLCESALALGEEYLVPGGHFVCKYFMGGEEKDFKDRLRTLFEKVLVFKPSASRKDSSEAYFIALHKR